MWDFFSPKKSSETVVSCKKTRGYYPLIWVHSQNTIWSISAALYLNIHLKPISNCKYLTQQISTCLWTQGNLLSDLGSPHQKKKSSRISSPKTSGRSNHRPRHRSTRTKDLRKARGNDTRRQAKQANASEGHHWTQDLPGWSPVTSWRWRCLTGKPPNKP